MAMIIPLNRDVDASERVDHQANAAPPAEIILFPGVRYERWTDEASTVTGDSPSATERGSDATHPRDWLEI